MIKGIHHVSIKCIKEEYEKVRSFYTDDIWREDIKSDRG